MRQLERTEHLWAELERKLVGLRVVLPDSRMGEIVEWENLGWVRARPEDGAPTLSLRTEDLEVTE